MYVGCRGECMLTCMWMYGRVYVDMYVDVGESVC